MFLEIQCLQKICINITIKFSSIFLLMYLLMYCNLRIRQYHIQYLACNQSEVNAYSPYIVGSCISNFLNTLVFSVRLLKIMVINVYQQINLTKNIYFSIILAIRHKVSFYQILNVSTLKKSDRNEPASYASKKMMTNITQKSIRFPRLRKTSSNINTFI